MRRTAVLVVAGLLTASAAYAQDHANAPRAERVEIAAIPIGGVTFLQSSDLTQPKFNDYMIGGSATANVNKWIGLEGDLSYAVGRRQDLTFNGSSLFDQKTPNLWDYSGNVIVNVVGSDRAVVP